MIIETSRLRTDLRCRRSVCLTLLLAAPRYNTCVSRNAGVTQLRIKNKVKLFSSSKSIKNNKIRLKFSSGILSGIFYMKMYLSRKYE